MLINRGGKESPLSSIAAQGGLILFGLIIMFALLVPGSTQAQESITYQFSSSGPVHAPDEDGSFAYTYDDNGNLKTISNTSGVTTYHYTVFNKLKQVDKGGSPLVSYVYGVNGARIGKRNESGDVTDYYYGNIGITESQKNRYYFVGSKRVAKRVGNLALSFFHQDHLGSVSTLTDSGGNTVLSRKYYEFGAVQAECAGPNQPDCGAVQDDHAYNDKRWDKLTDNYDYEARSYAAKSFRFIQPDDMIPDPTSPQMFNRYAYVNNNPMRYVDPSGHAPRESNQSIQLWSGDFFRFVAPGRNEPLATSVNLGNLAIPEKSKITTSQTAMENDQGETKNVWTVTIRTPDIMREDGKGTERLGDRIPLSFDLSPQYGEDEIRAIENTVQEERELEITNPYLDDFVSASKDVRKEWADTQALKEGRIEPNRKKGPAKKLWQTWQANRQNALDALERKEQTQTSDQGTGEASESSGASPGATPHSDPLGSSDENYFQVPIGRLAY